MRATLSYQTKRADRSQFFSPLFCKYYCWLYRIYSASSVLDQLQVLSVEFWRKKWKINTEQLLISHEVCGLFPNNLKNLFCQWKINFEVKILKKKKKKISKWQKYKIRENARSKRKRWFNWGECLLKLVNVKTFFIFW